MKEEAEIHTPNFHLHKCFHDRNMCILEAQSPTSLHSRGSRSQRHTSSGKLSVGDRKEKSRNCLASVSNYTWSYSEFQITIHPLTHQSLDSRDRGEICTGDAQMFMFAYVSSECQKKWTEAVLQGGMAKKLQSKGLEMAGTLSLR